MSVNLKTNLNNGSKKFEDISKPEKSLAIIIKDLVKQFGDITAVNGLNLEIKEGEFFSLLGPNGSGKTTTINILCGLLTPTKGMVNIMSYDIKKDLEQIKNIIGVCPQDVAVFKFLNSKENIELFGNLYSMEKNELKKRTEKLIKILGLSKDANRRVSGYSGGMLRKLNLIIAAINNPKILFLDEPTAGMDPRARRATWEFIKSLNEQKITIILTTHYIEEAEALSDRVGIIDYGELIELGSPAELIEKYEVKNLEEVFMKITGRRISEGI